MRVGKDAVPARGLCRRLFGSRAVKCSPTSSTGTVSVAAWLLAPSALVIRVLQCGSEPLYVSSIRGAALTNLCRLPPLAGRAVRTAHVVPEQRLQLRAGCSRSPVLARAAVMWAPRGGEFSGGSESRGGSTRHGAEAALEAAAGRRQRQTQALQCLSARCQAAGCQRVGGEED